MGQKLLLSLLLSLLILSVMPNLPNAYNAVTKNSFHPLVDVPAKGNLTLANKFQPNGVTLPLGENEPAPMGIADYGIGPNGPYIIRTNEFLGHIYLKRLLAYSSQANSYWVTFQLNVVLSYQYNGNTYSLWLQDVAVYNTINHSIIFIDNIWNFTSYNANVTCLKGNGHIYSWGSTTYYAYAACNYPGSPTTLSLPATICLLINVSTNVAGQPVIQFWYDDGYGWINYDTVVVTNVYDASNVYILVDGYQYTGNGLYYDAELVLAGPPGGYCAYVYNSSVYMMLMYFNGHNLQEVTNAYNFGSDTGETVNNVKVSCYYYIYCGLLLAGLHAGYDTLHGLWNQNTVMTLQINPGISQGYFIVYNKSYGYPPPYNNFMPFTNGYINLTLVPMDYAVLIYNSQYQLVGEAEVPATYGFISTGVTQFEVFAPPSVTMQEGIQKTIYITIDAYGDVNIYVRAPPSITYVVQSPVYIYGVGTVALTLNASSMGLYTICVTVCLIPGLYQTDTISVCVRQPLYYVTFSYNVIGQQLPQSPSITFEFPNGTITTIPLTSSLTLLLPPGTIYNVQGIIGSGEIRWATENTTSGVIYCSKTLYFIYYEQYLVTFTYKVQGGTGYGEPTIQYVSFGNTETTYPGTVWADVNSPYVYSQTLPGSNSQERWIANSYTGVVTSPGAICVYYYNQYYVTVNSPINVYALVNGVNTMLTSGWYCQGTSVQIENITQYPSSGERIVITEVSPSLSFTVNSPINVKITTVTQYFVNLKSPIPVYALINGSNETLSSGWYNANTNIVVENITYYPQQGVRYVITSIKPESFAVNNEVTVLITATKQYYVNLVSPIKVYALVNGENVTFTSGWYNEDTKIKIENITQYPAPMERIIIISINPQSTFVVKSPINVTINVVLQYFVKVISPIPVKACVNGTLENLNSSWFNKGTTIVINNYTYYVSNEEREVIVKISPSPSVTLSSPVTFNITTQKQYLVTINGVSKWYNAGSVITLSANVPFYEVGEFKGTYNVSPNAVIVVNGPINETLVETLNYPVVILLFTAVVLAIALAVFLVKYKLK